MLDVGLDVGSVEVFLGYFTGLRLLDDQIAFQTLVYSGAFVHLIDAVVCRIFADQKKLSQNLWMVYGLIFGVWAVLGVAFWPRKTLSTNSPSP